MSKDILRQKLSIQRRQLSASARGQLDAAVQSRLVASTAFRDAETVALYASTRFEAGTEQIFADARRMKKCVVYPRVVGEKLVFVPVTAASDMGAGAFGIREPLGDESILLSDIDLMLLPGLAFSRDGHRLGSGRGFYDRTLAGAERPETLVGLAYDFQLIETLPDEAHDVRLDLLVTDARVLAFASLITPQHSVDCTEGGLKP
jgi:5-formyltetrahydrofolate cyclo-ligase